MKSPFGFIIEPEDGKLYKTESSSGLDLSVTIDDGKHTNRFATVISTPTWYEGDINDGDRIIVHHNTFKKYNGYDGVERFSKSFIGEGRYFVEYDNILGFFKDNELTTVRDVIFVKPSQDDQYGVVIASNNSNKIKSGDTVGFTPHSEYVFFISGEKYYKMREIDVCITRTK